MTIDAKEHLDLRKKIAKYREWTRLVTDDVTLVRLRGLISELEQKLGQETKTEAT